MDWLSLIPPLLAVGLSILTKRVLPSLLVALLVGSFLVTKSLFGTFSEAIDYIVKVLSDRGNLHVLLFLYLFSGLVALVRFSGGVQAFQSFADRFVKSKTSVFGLLWGFLPLTFTDCGFRVVATGSIIKGLAEKHGIRRERLAFMLNNTASPVVELIPIATTFVGYNIGIIKQGLALAGEKDLSAYSLLVQSIPLQFFSILVILVTFGSVFFGGSSKKSAPKAAKGEKMHKQMDMGMDVKEPKLKPRLINLLLPMVTIIVLSVLLSFRGDAKAGQSLSSLIQSVDPAKTMLIALFISLLFTAILYIAQKYPLKEMAADLISGGNEIMPTIAILILAWPLSEVTQDLGLSRLIKESLGTSLPGWSVPVSLYIVTSLATYFMGSSWGAAAIIMPIAIPLAASTGASLPLAIAAVLTGGTFGDVTSPVSGMTNMSSHVSHADHMTYVRYASKFNIPTALASGVLFLVAAFL